MSQSPLERASGLLIGTVEFVSPAEIRVAVDVDAPESLALNSGTPRPFPRINNYLLVNVDDGFLVGQVEWMTIERSAFPMRRGMRDFGLVDLPYPVRRMSLNPVGTLRVDLEGRFVFQRGTEVMPFVGASVLLPTDSQLRSIVESAEHRRVRIGLSPIAGDADVYVDPNRIFGRHLAVLGNTGSGKSCSVAGLIRWSLAQARERAARHHAGEADSQDSRPNARFIILDPNGEYSRAFSPNDSTVRARIFTVGDRNPESALRVPLWLWNTSEWCAFTQASARTQRPLLRRALREVKEGGNRVTNTNDDGQLRALRRYLTSRRILIRTALDSGEIQSDETKFGFRLSAILNDLTNWTSKLPGARLESVTSIIQEAISANHNTFNKGHKTIEYFHAFNRQQVMAIVESMSNCIDDLGSVEVDEDGVGEDAPISFRGTELADHLEVLADQENVSQYVDFLVSRIRALLSDRRMTIITRDTDGITLSDWLKRYIGDDSERSVNVSVIDLSLVPTDVVHVITSVIARMVFEALQRYLKLGDTSLPTVLVMEEAHTFVKQYRSGDDSTEASTVCCQVFERIAREGRKFGLGLVLSSQRPSELSPTVLSQCNTFLLHRISNNHDQDIVHRLVPDNLRGLLRELPTLPSQMAILLGWASELPVLVRMNNLATEHQPRSEDPDYWEVWTRECRRNVDWERIAELWQEGRGESDEEGAEAREEESGKGNVHRVSDDEI